MEDKIKDIVTRPASNGEVYYTLDEQIFLIKEYIFEKKGVRPEFSVRNGMMEAMLLNTAFTASLEYFTDKINKNGNVQP